MILNYRYLSGKMVSSLLNLADFFDIETLTFNDLHGDTFVAFHCRAII